MGKPSKIVNVAAGILIHSDGRFLLASRPAGKAYAGYWEFPGGKLEAGETAHAALVRELHEEMGITVTAATPWIVQTFSYPHATVRLHFFRVTAWQGEPHPREGQALAWQAPGALTQSPILPANGPILRGLALPDTLALSNVAGLGETAWLDRLDAALERGLSMLVLREPQLDAGRYATLARLTLARARRHGCRVLLHDAITLARELEADGVQLSARAARTLQTRPDGLHWLGVSAHTPDELAVARRIGADYACIGHVKETASHPGAAPLGWSGYARLLSEGWPFPVYAIGGLAIADVATAQQYGGHGVAQLSGAWL
ncbi:MAG TPA: Nudix family hydrolase [Chitinolyticbacter sp.]|nr:Nudix family hydrolase [Chitinolyticbacter sp.]